MAGSSAFGTIRLYPPTSGLGGGWSNRRGVSFHIMFGPHIRSYIAVREHILLNRVIQNQSREHALLSAFDWLIFIIATVALALLILAYFVLPKLLVASNAWLIFLQSIITNLIPVLLLFVLSYIAYRRIETIRSERETELLAQKVADDVIERMRNESIPTLAKERDEAQGLVEKRSDITAINKQLISEADDVIASFSGDLSWVEGCQSELISAANRNVRIQLLCKDPITPEAKHLVEKYYRQPGIQIRYYPNDFLLSARGMMIDIPTTKKAVFFKKQHKSFGENFARGSGKPGDTTAFDYWLRICDAEDDLAIVAPFAQLFNILWERASHADILEKRDTDIQLIHRELKKIRQYSQSEFTIRRVKVANLRPLHRFIDEVEYNRIKLLAKRLQWQRLEFWDTLSIQSRDTRKIICPPLIEIQNDTWVIVDGLARVYHSRELGHAEIVACVIEKATEPLLGETWDWEHVRTAKESDYKKEDNFRHPEMSRWRHLDTFHTSLIHPIG